VRSLAAHGCGVFRDVVLLELLLSAAMNCLVAMD